MTQLFHFLYIEERLFDKHKHKQPHISAHLTPPFLQLQHPFSVIHLRPPSPKTTDRRHLYYHRWHLLCQYRGWGGWYSECQRLCCRRQLPVPPTPPPLSCNRISSMESHVLGRCSISKVHQQSTRDQTENL